MLRRLSLSILALMAGLLALSAAEAVRVRIGGLDIRIDPDRFRVAGEGDRFTIHCLGPRCEVPLMSVAVAPADAGAPCGHGSVLAPPRAHGEDGRDAVASRSVTGGLTIFRVAVDLGCRNLAGGPVFACTTHAGLTYRFVAADFGCRTSRATTADALALLDALSAP